jgi:NADH dehydrogenase FAD-containing subunit
MLSELRAHGVTLVTGAHVESIADAGVTYRCGGDAQVLASDSVILATGTRENRELAEGLAGLGAEIFLIGDCSGIGYIEGALLDAARVARAI